MTEADFKRWLDRYKYAERFPERSAVDWRAEAVGCLIEPLEAWLLEHPHIGGANRCWADAAVFPFVRQFAAVDLAWWASAPFPATRCWLDEWLHSPLFEAAMQKVPVWAPGHPPHRPGPAHRGQRPFPAQCRRNRRLRQRRRSECSGWPPWC